MRTRERKKMQAKTGQTRHRGNWQRHTCTFKELSYGFLNMFTNKLCVSRSCCFSASLTSSPVIVLCWLIGPFWRRVFVVGEQGQVFGGSPQAQVQMDWEHMEKRVKVALGLGTVVALCWLTTKSPFMVIVLDMWICQ